MGLPPPPPSLPVDLPNCPCSISMLLDVMGIGHGGRKANALIFLYFGKKEFHVGFRKFVTLSSMFHVSAFVKE